MNNSSMNTIKSMVASSLQQKTTEQVEKWRSELLYLDSSNIKIQEAIVTQNVIETSLNKSIPLLSEIREALDKLLLIETSDFSKFLGILESISQLHDRHQTMTKLLLSNWKFVSSPSHCHTQDSKSYYFPELGSSEQKVEISVPNFEVVNPILALLSLILAIKLNGQFLFMRKETIKFLGSFVEKQQVHIVNVFHDKPSFLKTPVSVFTFSPSLETKTFNSVYFYSLQETVDNKCTSSIGTSSSVSGTLGSIGTSSFLYGTLAPTLYQFKRDYRFGGKDFSSSISIDWSVEMLTYDEIMQILPFSVHPTSTTSSIGCHETTFGSMNGPCDLYYFSKSIYEWRYILPVLLFVTFTEEISQPLVFPEIPIPPLVEIQRQALTLTSVDSNLNFTYKVNTSGHNSCRIPSNPLSSPQTKSFLLRIEASKMSINDSWLSFVKGLSTFYSNLIKKYNLSLVKCKRDYSSIKFIAEMVTVQRKIKETNIELFTSLNRC